MSNVSAAELAERIGQFGPEEIIVDVRETDEYAEGHIPNSINLPLSSIGKNIETLKKYQKIYLICETGGRSSYAHEVLKTADISTIDITGGIFALKKAGVELEESQA
jgi:rhodanese-related sulfurtransferase